MDFLQKLQDWLLAVWARIRKMRNGLRPHDGPEHMAQGVPPDEKSPPAPVRAIVTFGDEEMKRTQAEANRQHRVQNSIKNATWSAFAAASIYAFISLLQWGQMLKQSQIASATLQRSTESFRIDERAWVEIQPIHAILVAPRDDKFGATFKYELHPQNFGKTAARNLVIKAESPTTGEGFSSNAEDVKKYQDQYPLNQFNEMGTDKPVVVPANPIPKVLGPGIESPVPFILTGQLIGRMDYVDAFGVPHWVKFCFSVANAKGDLWNCKEGNNEDNNPEAPPN